MNQMPPPLNSVSPPASKPTNPTWVIVLIACGIAGLMMVVVIGLLAAIAIPNFVRARKTAQMNMCINNLRMLDGAKQQWALENKKEATDTPAQDDVAALLRNRQFPVCPAGGVYTVKPVGEEPTCSIPDHQLSTTSRATSH